MTQAQILIVEDDSIIALELKDRLQSLGYNVRAMTPSGEDAIAKADDLRPDLVLMDIRLRGELDGVEAAAKIRECFDIPVVYLTAYADKDTLQRAKITEPYGYILKPFEERELHTAIEMALYKHTMEQKLKKSEQWLGATLRSIGDAVIATDETGLVSLMNPVAETLTGWTQKDALGKDGSEIFRIVDGAGFPVAKAAINKALYEGIGADLVEHTLLARDGKEILVDDSIAPIIDEKGNVQGVVLVFRDITERKNQEEEKEKLQAQLFQAQKMEAVGVLAGGIAHDFNNLMTTIIGYSSLILANLDDKDPKRKGIRFIRRSGERAASLTEQLLALSRRQMSQPKALDLNAVIIDMEEMLQRLVGEDVELLTFLEPKLRSIKADPIQVEQVVMNLVVNAHEAMRESGQITIKTETVTVDNSQDMSTPQAHPGIFVRLSVTDTGIGMNSETMQHIFEPFFSTKQKGSGLGLAIVYNIAEQCEGWVEVNSEIGQGSTFQVYLPALAEILEREPAEAVTQPKLQGQGERILLVEDDEGVRTTISEMLCTHGYTVVETENAIKALEIFEKEGQSFDLVFSDVVLPDRDGLQLVEEILSLKPQLPILLTSGYTDQRAQWPLIREREFHFLQKPFDLSSLLQAISQALEEEVTLSNE
jgi:two-component system cell cycle sensor histidine kinase/response regulator CckA